MVKQEIKEAKAIIKNYSAYSSYIYDYYIGEEKELLLVKANSWYGTEHVPLDIARREYQEQCQINKFDGKFVNRVYKLALKIKEFIEFAGGIYETYILDKYIRKNFNFKKDVYLNLWDLIEEYGTMLPTTRELMYQILIVLR